MLTNKDMKDLERAYNNEIIFLFYFPSEIDMFKRLVDVQKSLLYVSEEYVNGDITVFYNKGYNDRLCLKFYKLRELGDNLKDKAYALRLCLGIRAIPVKIDDLARTDKISENIVKYYKYCIDRLKKQIDIAKQDTL